MSKEYLEIIKRTLVNNGEYDFKDEKVADNFARDILYKSQNEYSTEGYYHKYEDFGEFLHTHHVDSIAYWLYEDKYSVSIKG